MKKRNIIFALLMAMTMLITACGSGNQTLDGKWVGTMDLTKQFEDGVKTAYPDLAEYVDFEDLVFVFDVAFVDGEMSMVVQQASVDSFNKNFAAGMEALAEEYWTAGLAQIDMTMEEAMYESGMDEAAYLQRIYSTTGIDKMITSMTDVTNKTIERISKMEGTYTTPVDNELRLYYTENEYESMDYSFKGKVLNIVIKGDGFSLKVECEKSK